MPDTPARPATVFSTDAIESACAALYGGQNWPTYPEQYQNNQRDLMRQALEAADQVHRYEESQLLDSILDNAQFVAPATTEESSVVEPGTVKESLAVRSAVKFCLTAESLIAACVPPGSVCDPQAVADAIRSYFSAHATAEDSSVVGPTSKEFLGVECSGAVPVGYALVPVEPTTAMLDAFHNGQLRAKPDGDYYGRPTYSAEGMYRAGYAAMLAAAPEPQHDHSPGAGKMVCTPHHGDAPVAEVGWDYTLIPAAGAKLFIGQLLYADPVTAPAAAHSDDVAVDRFALLMKQKLAAARDKGRGGWDDPEQCDPRELAELLCGHIGKSNAGNYIDIANFCMMLTLRDAPASLLSDELNRCVKWQFDAQLPGAPADARDAEIAALRAFANDVIAEHVQFDPNIQDLAEQHGLLAQVTVAESCGDNCECAEVGFPTECYRKTAILMPADSAMGAGGEA